MDFKNFSATQWINIGVFALSSLAMAAFWQSMYTPAHAVAVQGGLLYVVSVLNFVLTGKAPVAPAPVSTTTPTV